MVEPKHTLQNAITELLSRHGFVRKSSTWYLDGAECLCLVDLQKSNFGQQYYLNLAITPKSLEKSSFPKEHQCHVRGRLSEIVSDKKSFESDLNLEEGGAPAEEKTARVVDAINSFALPILLDCQTLAGIKEKYAAGIFKRFLVTLKMKQLIGVL